MGTFLFKAALAALLVQAPHPDSVRAGLWARVAADSTNGPAWLDLGRAYLQRAADYHTHRKPMTVDTVWAHATLDTAQLAFERVPAHVYRVYAFRSEEHTSELQSQSNLVCRL